VNLGEMQGKMRENMRKYDENHGGLYICLTEQSNEQTMWFFSS
jgi:hypothetical protein